MQVNFLLPVVKSGGISVVNPRRVRREIPSDRVERFIQPLLQAASFYTAEQFDLGQSADYQLAFFTPGISPL